MSAIWLLARSHLRANLRALIMLTLMVAVFGAVVLASVSGARRTSTSFGRMLSHLDSADVNIGQDSALRPDVLEGLAALPSVEAAGQAAFLLMAPEGVDQFGVNAVAPADEHWLRDVDRVLVTEGRMPTAVHEVLLTEALALRAQTTVGGTLTFTSFDIDQLEELFSGDAFEPKGPPVTARVVGIGRHPHHLSSGSVEAQDAVFSHAFYREYGDQVLTFGPSLMVKLRGGLPSLQVFRDEVAGLEARIEGPVHVGIGSFEEDNDIRVVSNHELYRSAREAVQMQGVALWLFAGLLALTTTLILGQAMSRGSSSAGVDAPVVRALGLSRSRIALASAIPGMLAASLGMLIAGAIAASASGVFPSGFARRAEPSPGFAPDLVALGIAGGAMLTLLIGGGGRGAFRTARAAGRLERDTARAHPSSVAATLSRAGGSVPAVVGVRMALEPGRGRTAVPVRTAYAGAVAGIAALVAALGVGASLDRFIATPAAYVVNWDAAVSGGDDPATIPRTIERLSTLDGIDELSAFVLADVRVGGQVAQGYLVDRLIGDVTLGMAEGRAPAAPGEVALGTATMRRLNVAIGDQVEVRGRASASMTIVGRAVFPAIDEDLLDDGAVFDASASEAIDPVIDYPVFPVRFVEGIDPDAMFAALTAEFGGTDTHGIDRPGEVENLARVASVPRILASLLILLSLATIAHASVTTARRRARDLAVLKTIGFERRQVVRALRTQGATFAVIACVLGIPAGVIGGRWAWISVSNGIGVSSAPDPALVLSAIALPVALLAVTMAIATMAARATARTRPALALRAE